MTEEQYQKVISLDKRLGELKKEYNMLDDKYILFVIHLILHGDC